MFHSEPQSSIYPCKTTYTETKQMGNSTNLVGKTEYAQFTVQDNPARLHASYILCNIAGYLARCCTQYVARYLARSIALCRQVYILICCFDVTLLENLLSFKVSGTGRASFN